MEPETLSGGERFGSQIDIPLPDDFHIHLRQGLPLTTYTRDAVLSFGRVLVMPNTRPPVRIPMEVEKYRARILAASRGAVGFEPLMSFYVDSAMGETEVAALAGAGVVAGKLYPQGATTNSQEGVSDIERAFPVFESMEERDIVLCIHGEIPDAFVLDREAAFLPKLEAIVQRFPKLRVVLEHVTSAEAVKLVKSMPANVAATITVHHLMFTLDDVIGGFIRPHHFCKPVAKRYEDRDALREAAFSGDTNFFFGSDSAPHPVSAKECDCGCAGVYSAPTAMPLLIALFEEHSDLQSLVAFTAQNGARFYGLPESPYTSRYVRSDWKVPERSSDVVPLAAGQTLSWQQKRRVLDGGEVR